MKEKIKNIINLTMVYIKENNESLKIINFKTRQINKRNIIFWTYVILLFAITYVSYQAVEYLKKIGKPEIFLNGYFLFLEILIILKTIILSINIFYFSKDIENILYLPLKPVEILLSKFNTLLYMNYEMELIFGLLPFIIYGIYNSLSLMYYINLILVLIIFPIFATLIVSIIMIFLMKTIKLFKNKDLMQIIITFILIAILMVFLNETMQYIFNNMSNIQNNQQGTLDLVNDKIIETNKYFLSIYPATKILEENNFKVIVYYFELIVINLLGFALFYFFGNKFYLEQLLKANFYFKPKKNKKIKLNKKVKKYQIGKSYLKKEIKLLTRNPMFFMQSIYNVILITVVISILIIALVPQFRQVMQIEEYKEQFKDLKFDIEAVCIITGLIQITTLFNYCSITAYSREGKYAYYLKTLPVSLHKQFIYKNISQIFLNTICAIIILIMINLEIPEISCKYFYIMFIISFLMIIINSFILTLIDLLMPKLEWDSEYEILKNSKNKLLQYVLIVFNILFLNYIEKIFKNYNLDKSLYILIGILFLILIILNILFSKFKNKLYKNIN